MLHFHPLEVTEVRRETRDAVVVTLRPREEDRAAFAFSPGQHLTFRRHFDGEELRRCYSICSGLDDGALRVGIKRVSGGAFSNWANEALAPGEIVEAMAPTGAFGTLVEPDAARHYLAFAAGSGITPILSIIKTVLAREPRSSVTLVYANRQVGSIMFREELEDLKNLHLGRLAIIHILKSDAQEIDLFSGRIDEGKLSALFKGWIDLPSVDTAFICGPEPLMLTIAASLESHGLPKDRIRFELFGSAQTGRAKATATSAEAAAAGTAEITVTLDGTRRTFTMPKAGQSIIDAALAAHIDVPYGCKAGVCSTCRAKVTEGEVEMAANHALEDYEVRAGFVLTCQCTPLTDTVAVTYDGH